MVVLAVAGAARFAVAAASRSARVALRPAVSARADVALSRGAHRWNTKTPISPWTPDLRQRRTSAKQPAGSPDSCSGRRRSAARSSVTASWRERACGEPFLRAMRSWKERGWPAADGLWRIDAAALDGPQPVGDRSAKIISPRPTRLENKNGDEDGHEEIRKLERVAGRWCRTDGISSGDQYSDTLCFDSADGLSFGTRQFSGGEFCEVRFCLRPRDCRALGR